MIEPGNVAPPVRLTISMTPQDEANALALKHTLEAKLGQRMSMSELFRQGIDCLRQREGL